MTDLQAEFLRVGKILLDIPLRIDNNGNPALFVAKKVRSMGKTTEIVLFQDHRAESSTVRHCRSAPISWFAGLPRQCESDIHGALRVPGCSGIAGCDHYVLTPIHHVGRRSCHPRERQISLPQDLPGTRIEGAQRVIVYRRGDKQNTARRHNWASIIFCSGIADSLLCQFGILPERNPPKMLTCLEIDRVQRPPWWRDSWISIRIEKFAIARKNVLVRPLFRIRL